MTDVTEAAEGYGVSRRQRIVHHFGRAGFEATAQAMLAVDRPLTGREAAEAVDALVARHDILRTGITVPPGTKTPLQVVVDRCEVAWDHYDLRATDETTRRDRLTAIAEHARHQVSALGKSPTVHGVLIDLPGNRCGILLTTHAVRADRRSFEVLAEELAGILSGEGPAEEPLQYAQFAEWEGTLDEPSTASASEPAIPAGHGRPEWPEAAGGHATGYGVVRVRTDDGLAALLKRYATRRAVSPQAVLFTAFRVLLGRTAGAAGSEAAFLIDGRQQHEDLREAVGPYTAWAGKAPFSTLAAPFGRLVTETEAWLDRALLEDEPDAGGRTAAWDHAFEFHDGVPTTAAVSVEWTDVVMEPHVLRLVVRDSGGGSPAAQLVLDWHHDRARLAGRYVTMLAERLFTLLSGALADDTLPADSLRLIGAEELHFLTDTFHDSAGSASGGTGLPVHRAVHARAAADPDRTAVVAADRSLTYGRLDGMARRLAAGLRELGVGPETPVGIRLDHLAALPVAVLGVLNAGAAYVPLDPGHPTERAARLLAHTSCEVLLTTDRLDRPDFAGTVLLLDDLDALAGAPEPGRVAGDAVGDDQLAYIMHTSGSSGVPKGVMVQHGALANYLTWSAGHYLDGSVGGSVVHSSIAFDLTVTSLLSPLVAGRSVRLLAKAQTDPLELARVIEEDPAATLIKLTPSHLRILNQARRDMPFPVAGRTLVVGGEALTADLLEDWKDCRVVNEYGPTETVVGCCVHEAVPGAEPSLSVPIGSPITGARLHVLDEKMEPVPVASPGELYIGGDVVSRGYFGAPDLTAERFVPDPFATRSGSRLYRTGDLVCHLPEGGLRYLGRSDAQLKLRGFRIEPGEVEAVLRRHESVADAAVTLAGPPEAPELCAYLVPAGAPRPSAESVHRHAAGQLPEHMVPTRWQWLDTLPLTRNGKVDTAALPTSRPVAAGTDGGVDRTAAVVAGPKDSVELALLLICEELLGRTGLGVRDDFFDAGGHSLLAVRLIAKAEAVLGVGIPLSALFKDEVVSVERLAAMVRERSAAGGRPDPLVMLSSAKGPRLPLFLVHPGGGQVLGYRDLALAVGADRPVYAFQDPSEETGPHQSVPELAETYRTRLLEACPDGPFLLAGWSFGGLVAFELARRLTAGGRAPRALVLVDSYPAQPAATGADLVRGFAEEAGRALGIDLEPTDADLEGRSAEEAVHAMITRATGEGRVPADIGVRHVSGMFRLHVAHLRAAEAFSPAGAARVGETHLVQAAVQDRADRDRAARLWQDMTDGQVVRHLLAGDHYSLMRAPQVQGLAELIAALDDTGSAS
ncbi:amino acid adenylation domain-containing protein [Streptomyces sp. NBC_00102]|uniref:non-ribosomal peptide synthetase n=1 Tax=Streptomyces sp. NBC_00102 TaxID=2975652 RepID=UPI00225285D2|nr:amino acid adenylation domain-containing protein [Streptomyces sp. NBC_00102]MCX5395492.1 amino acid adenylation domain-containing protein [Streptomyces sp. NBC_00102]